MVCLWMILSKNKLGCFDKNGNFSYCLNICLLLLNFVHDKKLNIFFSYFLLNLIILIIKKHNENMYTASAYVNISSVMRLWVVLKSWYCKKYE